MLQAFISSFPIPSSLARLTIFSSFKWAKEEEKREGEGEGEEEGEEEDEEGRGICLVIINKKTREMAVQWG